MQPSFTSSVGSLPPHLGGEAKAPGATPNPRLENWGGEGFVSRAFQCLLSLLPGRVYWGHLLLGTRNPPSPQQWPRPSSLLLSGLPLRPHSLSCSPLPSPPSFLLLRLSSADIPEQHPSDKLIPHRCHHACSGMVNLPRDEPTGKQVLSEGIKTRHCSSL